MQKKGKSSKAPKLPELSILEIACHRAHGDVLLDGRLRVQTQRPVKKLQLLIDFLGTDRQLLTTKRGEVTANTLEAGDEVDFQMRVADPIRAIYYSVRAEDGDGRDLSVEKAGPFTIE